MNFNEMFSQATVTLNSLQHRVYHLHLLGWTNQEIVDELGIHQNQVALQLYSARKDVKEYLHKNYGYAAETVHQQVMDLQKTDIELLSETLFQQRLKIKEEGSSKQRNKLSEFYNYLVKGLKKYDSRRIRHMTQMMFIV